MRRFPTLISIAAVVIAWLLPPAGAGAAEELPANLRAELDRQTQDDAFSGVVLLAHGGNELYQNARGEADREKHLPNSLETRFRFGSLGKMFTGVAILQLVQAGKLSLDDPLDKFLPNYSNAALAKATIHQLLTHTAGAGDIFGPDFLAHRAQLRQLEDYVRAFEAREPRFTPGERHEYSNYGYILLGRVVEKISGGTYADYVREHIFRPVGMKSTDNLSEESRVPGLAVPYAGGRSAMDSLPWSGTSAGGGYSTARDLLRFATALQSGKLLDGDHTKLLLAGKVETPRLGMRYAYGFEDATFPDGKRRVGHGGGAPGMNAVLSIFPDSGYVLVVLANVDPPAAMDIDRAVTRLLP